MLEALLDKNASIPDSFNNCLTYFYKDIISHSNNQILSKNLIKMTAKLFLVIDVR